MRFEKQYAGVMMTCFRAQPGTAAVNRLFRRSLYCCRHSSIQLSAAKEVVTPEALLGARSRLVTELLLRGRMLRGAWVGRYVWVDIPSRGVTWPPLDSFAGGNSA